MRATDRSLLPIVTAMVLSFGLAACTDDPQDDPDGADRRPSRGHHRRDITDGGTRFHHVDGAPGNLVVRRSLTPSE